MEELSRAKKPAFFDFYSVDLAKAVQHPVIQKGLEFLINNTCSLNHEDDLWYRGDMEIFNRVKQGEKPWDLVKDKPLSYAALYEKLPVKYSLTCEQKGTCEVESIENIATDLSNRRQLLTIAWNTSCPEWYSYAHQCQSLSVFFIYPLCRLLFPEDKDKFAVYHGPVHSCIIDREYRDYLSYGIMNKQTLCSNRDTYNNRTRERPLVYDFNYMVLGLTVDEIFWNRHIDRDTGKLTGEVSPRRTGTLCKGMEAIEWWFEQMDCGSCKEQEKQEIKNWYQQMLNL
jgi:hypothetical protein